ncbi:MAG: phenylalanine--tRNA ligase subunit alpha [Dehalococcoidia bacterium]|jgi:phenylalanyl-tRNA synthetase alpha chain
MIKELEQLLSGALKELETITQDKALEDWRVRYLGKKSQLTTILRGLAGLPIEERKKAGALANRIKAELESGYQQKEQTLRESQLESAAGVAGLDITLPGRIMPLGRLHPITQTINEIHEIFVSMGFEVRETPEVEWDYYNFEALNIPEHHPARDSMATLWVDAKNERGERKMLMRTHNTAGDVRAMEVLKPPIRVVTTGKVYRYEASDATHVPMFYQIDGFAVDKSITMAELKGTLYEFSRRFFGKDRKVRFRCDYFPFVEPGVEMAVECGVCHGRGCRLCGNSGWIEILGAGMTHPKVLERGGLDPQVYSSFAFGMGIDRLPMLRYGIDDIRLFFGSDLRFLRQF